MPCLSAPDRAVQQVHHVHADAGGVVRSTINLAKLVLSLIFLLMVGTCVYVCGSVLHDDSKTSSH